MESFHWNIWRKKTGFRLNNRSFANKVGHLQKMWAFTLHPPKKNNSNNPEMIVFAGLISGFSQAGWRHPMLSPWREFRLFPRGKIHHFKEVFPRGGTLLLSRAVISDNRNGKTHHIHPSSTEFLDDVPPKKKIKYPTKKMEKSEKSQVIIVCLTLFF